MKKNWQILKKSAEAARAEHADTTQRSWLMACLRRNAATAYGRRYDFASIRDEDDYRAWVPLVACDDLAESIREIAGGGADILFAGTPVAFELTGGSGGGRRLIPYSRESLADFRAAMLPWIGSLAESCGLGAGRAYLAISPVLRPCADLADLSDVPVGLPDGAYLGAEAAAAFAGLFAVPPQVAAAASVEEWRILTGYYLLRTADLELVSVWSPTFWLGILEGIAAERERLSSLLRGGGRIGGHALDADEAAFARLASYDETSPETLWPTLMAISCWADASSAPYAERLASLFPHASVQGKGLLLTEGAVTVPDACGRPLPVQHGFTEFLDECGRSLLAHELREGEVYEVAMTTAGGLYRYRAGDCVRCEGFLSDSSGSVNVPILRFAGRCGLCSDLVGEKLTDVFAAACTARAGCRGMLVPDSSGVPGYLLLTEDGDPVTAARLDEALCANPQYAYARKLGQLRPVAARQIDNLAARYTAFALAADRNLGDIKLPALCPDPLFAKFSEAGPRGSAPNPARRLSLLDLP